MAFPGSSSVLDQFQSAKYPTGVAILLSHCVSCGIADYRCHTPTSFCKMAYRSERTGLTRGYSRKSLPLKPIAP